MRSHDRTKRPPVGKGLLLAQSAVLLLAAVFFTVMPPENGPVLLVPLHGPTALGLMDRDARLLGKGRFPGSVVVTGPHPSFMSALLVQGVLVLPAVPVLCGSTAIAES